jgi:hypothetical protein
MYFDVMAPQALDGKGEMRNLDGGEDQAMRDYDLVMARSATVESIPVTLQIVVLFHADVSWSQKVVDMTVTAVVV